MGNAASRKRSRVPAVAAAPMDAATALAVRAQTLAAAGDVDRAITLYAEAVSRGCMAPGVFNDLGTLLARRGQFPAAVVQYELALMVAPGAPEIRKNLIMALEAMALSAFNEKRWLDASASYGRLCVLDPRCALFQTNAGRALRELRQPERALPYLKKAAELEPDDSSVHLNLGSLLYDLNQREAEPTLRRAIALDPTNIAALVNLGAVQNRLSQLAAAAETARRVLALAPENAAAHGNLAGVLREQGDIAASLVHYRRALAAQPDSMNIFSSYLLARQADPTATPAELLADHRVWEERFAKPLDPGPTGGFGARAPEPDKRLRIGYVSADLRSHSVASFIEPLLGAHDRATFEVFCYSSTVPDAVTARIRTQADEWRETRHLTDAALAELVARDQIDILVDLAGHTAENRLQAFARRPAPVQVSYCGYPGTTGLSAIGWRLTDATADPQGDSDPHYAERLWRLPNGFLCYQPEVADLAPAGPPPALAWGMVTFGSFNNLSKLNDGVLDLWAEVLSAVPSSRLLLKCRGLGDDGPRERVWGRFAAHGIAPERITVAPYTATRLEHLAVYGEVDIGLDSFPYNGTTTTCEAMWMGVPVVTLRGSAHPGRVGPSLMTRVGLSDLVAATPEAYVRTCARLAADLGGLAELRAGMRARVAGAPLGTPALMARDIEAAFRGMWRGWCRSVGASASAERGG
ncbi:MAG TPA: tetratricopeptide repeat protein [Polyangia bacterium]|jgi:predicted O-linked N-acetylglucosamine transferase (SPINDLY family)